MIELLAKMDTKLKEIANKGIPWLFCDATLSKMVISDEVYFSKADMA